MSAEHPVTDEKIRVLRGAVAAAIAYIETERTAPVGPPNPDAFDASLLASFSMDSPADPDAVVAALAAAGEAGAMRSTGGRYFGFVNGGVTPAALASSVLTSAWDQNAALAPMSPVSAAIDEVAARWIVDVLGLPEQSVASFCAGATVANLTGVIAARDALLARLGWDVQADGLFGAPPIDVITSAEAHVSALKAIRLAGLGASRVQEVPTDACGRLRPELMELSDRPALLVLQAGNVNTGHSDPFDEIIDRLDREKSWVHVDGAFGLWANAAPERRVHVKGVERADSWATDGHKWLNTPYDCGVFICSDSRALRSSMQMDASYVPTGAEERSLMNLGIQMSQAARAVPVWAVLATEGRAGVAAAIERCCALAEQAAARLTEASGGSIEVLAPVVLNQALFAFGDDARTDAVIEAVQASGECWVGGTTWQGRRAMRFSVSDVSTTEDDIDRAIGAVLRAAQT